MFDGGSVVCYRDVVAIGAGRRRVGLSWGRDLSWVERRVDKVLKMLNRLKHVQGCTANPGACEIGK